MSNMTLLYSGSAVVSTATIIFHAHEKTGHSELMIKARRCIQFSTGSSSSIQKA